MGCTYKIGTAGGCGPLPVPVPIPPHGECPIAMQIVGQKSWIGFTDTFNHPAFRGNWASGAWQTTATGGGSGGGVIVPPATQWNFDVGDLVVQEYPAQGPITDYLTGIAQSYPVYYRAFICYSQVIGSATAPAADPGHFVLWDFCVFYVAGGQLYRHDDPVHYDGTPEPSGPPIK